MVRIVSEGHSLTQIFVYSQGTVLICQGNTFRCGDCKRHWIGMREQFSAEVLKTSLGSVIFTRPSISCVALPTGWYFSKICSRSLNRLD